MNGHVICNATTFKHMYVGKRIISAILFILLGTLGPSCSYSDLQTEVRTAEEFITALNAEDIDGLIKITTTPFLYQNQQWESAKDGSGFTLGTVEERIVREPQAMRLLFVDLTRSIRVEGTVAVETPPSRESLLREYLAGSSKWASLNVYVFLRGFGDVEHIAIVGVDPSSTRVAAFYVN